MQTRSALALLATALTLLALAASASAAPTQLTVRIEGKDATLFEGPILTDGRDVQAASDTQPRRCDSTNNGAHPEPHATPTASAADAMTIVGDGFDGKWYPGFDDYFVTRWSLDGQFENDFAYWGLLVNGRFTSVGGCQYANAAGDEVLWVWDAFNSKPFLRLAAANDPSPAPGPPLPTATVAQGQPLALHVEGGSGAMDGAPESVTPVAGAAVAPVDTDPVKGYQQVNAADPATVQTAADGSASISFATPGWHRLKAVKSGYVRSNRIDVCVTAPGSDECGPLPADARVRSVSVAEPPPQDPSPTDPEPRQLPPPAVPPAGSTPIPAPVRLSAPVVGRAWGRGRITVKWRVLDPGVGVGSFVIESRTAPAGRWVERVRGSSSAASLTLPAGVSSRLRLRVVDALGRATTTGLGSVLVPRDDRALAFGSGWRRARQARAWEGTLTSGGRGAALRLHLGAGRPVLFVRAPRHRALIELSGAGPRELLRVAPSGSSRALVGKRRDGGVLTVRIVSGTVGLDGVAVAR